MDDKEIVSTVRQALLDKVGSDIFDTWIGERVTLHLEDGHLSVLAPDPFTLDRLRNKLRGEIEAACRDVAPGIEGVAFRLNPTSDRLAKPRTRTRSVRDEQQADMKSAPARSPSNTSAKSAGAPVRGAARGAGGTRADRVGADNASNRTTGATSSTRGRLAADVVVETPRRRFVVGDSNRLAFTAAQSVAQRPGSISPLFLYGPTGCGKSLLLDGLMRELRGPGKLRRVVLLSAEQFTSQFLEALQGSGLPSFRRKHRDVDALLIDDVQFFGGKRATTVELQNTVDTLQRQGRQLILAADRPPEELPGIGVELVGRLRGGLVCAIEAPDVDVRQGILRQVARQLEFPLPEAIEQYLASELTGDARLLTGALHRLRAHSTATKTALSMELVQTALADLLRANRRVIRLPDIEQAVCNVFGVEASSLQSDGKTRMVSQPRMLAMWLARRHTRAALSEIGQYFGRRSHTSVIAAHKKVDQLLASRSPQVVDSLQCSFAEAVRRVESQLRTG